MAGLTPGEGLLLSGVAGAVDGVGWVVLHVFTAHITGNTVHVGTDAGGLDLAAAWRPAFAIAAFVAGVAFGAVTREACSRNGVPARAAVLAVSALLLSAFVVAGLALGGAGSGAASFALLAAPAALAMGCQNAVTPRIAGRRVRTYITGVMTEFAEALVAAATSRDARPAYLRRAVELFGLWAAYLVGAAVSGYAGARWGAAAGLFPVGALALVIAVELRRWQAPAVRERSPVRA